MTIFNVTSNESYALLVRKRSSFQARLRIFQNHLTKLNPNEILTDNDKDGLGLRLSKMETLLTNFNEVQSDIECVCDNPDEQYLERNKFYDNFYHAIEQARTYLAEPTLFARSASIGSLLESVVNGNELGNNAPYVACNSPVARPINDELHSKNNSSNALGNDDPPPNRGLFTNPAAHPKRSCIVCKGDHAIYDCVDFLKEPAIQRRKIAAKMKMCLNCLRVGHHVNKCRHSSCRLCKKRHNTLLHTQPQRHETRPGDEKKQVLASARTSQGYETRLCDPDEEKHFKQVSASVKTSQRALFAAAMDMSFDNDNNSQSVRALLDCGGSTSSVVTEKLAKVLQPQITAANAKVKKSTTHGTQMPVSSTIVETQGHEDQLYMSSNSIKNEIQLIEQRIKLLEKNLQELLDEISSYETSLNKANDCSTSGSLSQDHHNSNRTISSNAIQSTPHSNATDSSKQLSSKTPPDKKKGYYHFKRLYQRYRQHS